MTSPITVFTAKRIITMNDSQPTATAVAVRDGKIVSVGSLEDLKPWLEAHPYETDHTFEGKVIMPGFIDPHLHPFLSATTLYGYTIAAFEWRLPWGTFPGVRGRQAYLDRLKEAHSTADNPDEPFITWGFHRLFHGDVTRKDLDEISSTQPIIVWQRSAHEMIFNTAALKHFNLTAEEAGDHPQINYDEGRYFEAGLIGVGFPKLASFVFEPKRYLDGTARNIETIHFGGLTTVADLSFGVTNPDLEWLGPKEILDNDNVPFRVYHVADVKSQSAKLGREEALEWVESLPERNSHRLRFLKSIKLFADGAIFSQYMQLRAGYIDGHHGEWMTPPETFEDLARLYWQAGYKIHVHTNGDLGLDLVLDTLQKLQDERPRFDHRFTVEHFGYSSADQVRRMARLGAVVSANPYYLYELGEKYAQLGMGVDRASAMSRLGSLERMGIPFALHSDLPMAPGQPLLLAWVAVNRIGSEGNVLCPEECVSLHQALRAITIDAAFILGVEDEIGSIESGKIADFTILEEDPYKVPNEQLKDIPIWGTVFEGKRFPIEK
jgi:predicted amidohydrolase YtcJ